MARAAAGHGHKRVLIATPPRHGKSLLTSVWTPAWFLAMWPHKRVILCSYESQIATAWGRQVRNLLDEHQDVLGVTLAKDSKAAGRWNTAQGGGMLCAGVGGPITGMGADLFLVDDPVKNSQQANSIVDRNTKDDWWRETARTRLEPNASVVMIQTRWHEDDLMGRRLAARDRGEEAWFEIKLPALATENDPLGRAVGEPLWPERYDLEALAELKRDVGSRGWGSLFQQSPLPAEGGIFKAPWFHQRYAFVDGMLHLPGARSAIPWTAIPRFATIDPALKEKEIVEEDAFSVICVWGVSPAGQLLLLDVTRKRMSSPDLVAEMLRIHRQWEPTALWVEKQSIGTAVLQWARKAGLRCRELDADRDKATRAMGAAPSCEAGRVLLPYEAHWLGDFLHELLAAPTGTFWDQVDAFSYGVQVYDQHNLEGWPLWGKDAGAGKQSADPDVSGSYLEDREGLDDDEDDDEKLAKDDWLDGLASKRNWRGRPW